MSKKKQAIKSKKELGEAMVELLNDYYKLEISGRIKRGLAKRKIVLEKSKRSYNKRNIK
ncbi:MAG: hypothetical protein US70_C0011G0020 [Parcubacteria group bacterium GW2011_GWD2_38_11]|nr:MAG: hypothetical protein US70_C0011G0020 [Parcubacteria group bacterium GW2011_GWD2_38_11]